MKEFILFISADGNPMEKASAEQMQRHVQKVGAYIESLVKNGKLRGAKPLEFQGAKISGTKGNIVDGSFNETKEVISGYYHILAKDLEEAVGIAKADPRFDDANWTIEIRPIMKVDGIN
jgi:hypothetical protein